VLVLRRDGARVFGGCGEDLNSAGCILRPKRQWPRPRGAYVGRVSRETGGRPNRRLLNRLRHGTRHALAARAITASLANDRASGWDLRPVDAPAAEALDFLAAGLADLVFPERHG